VTGFPEIASSSGSKQHSRAVSPATDLLFDIQYLLSAIPMRASREFRHKMSPIELLIQNNRAWSERMTSDRPDFFQKLAEQQSPKYLWIGCADSRVPANEVVGLMPGELFVHRNVANLVYASDPNCLSVVAYAVGVLKVEHIIVCGHYGCGGVKAAMSDESHGFIDNWLSKIKEVCFQYQEDLDPIADMEERVNRLCELNVIEQVKTLSRTAIVQDTWHRSQPLCLHGWIYGLKDGLIKDLGIKVERLEQVPLQFRFRLAVAGSGRSVVAPRRGTGSEIGARSQKSR
jgi:carbonic anhydrase